MYSFKDAENWLKLAFSLFCSKFFTVAEVISGVGVVTINISTSSSFLKYSSTILASYSLTTSSSGFSLTTTWSTTTSWFFVATVIHWFSSHPSSFGFQTISFGRVPFCLWFTYAEIWLYWVSICLIHVACEVTTYPIEDVSLYNCFILLWVFSISLSTRDNISSVLDVTGSLINDWSVLWCHPLGGTYGLTFLWLKPASQLHWYIYLQPMLWSSFKPWFSCLCHQGPW